MRRRQNNLRQNDLLALKLVDKRSAHQLLYTRTELLNKLNHKTILIEAEKKNNKGEKRNRTRPPMRHFFFYFNIKTRMGFPMKMTSKQSFTYIVYVAVDCVILRL